VACPSGSVLAERNSTADPPFICEVTKMKRQSCALLLMLLAAASSAAFADTQDDQEKACKSDAFRLCSSDIPNRHYDQLSPPCKKMFKSGNGK
jgi:hypothetical protein